MEQIDATISITTEVQTVFYPRLSAVWLDDVRDEEAREPVRDARRRQIVVAAIFADSYLFEWVRDDLLKEDPERWDRLFELFPEGDRRGVTDRWKEVPKALRAEGLITEPVDLGGMQWTEFLRLVSYRDGLIHGKASRPEGSQFPAGREPVPTMNQLTALDPAWATTTVVALVGLLHEAAGTQPPDWV